MHLLRIEVKNLNTTFHNVFSKFCQYFSILFFFLQLVGTKMILSENLKIESENLKIESEILKMESENLKIESEKQEIVLTQFIF